MTASGLMLFTRQQELGEDHDMRNPRTIEVTTPTGKAFVTFNPDAYNQESVYLHTEEKAWWQGTVIGLLGGMVGHGAYAHVGLPEWQHNRWAWPTSSLIGWFVGHVSRDEAAQRMVTILASHGTDGTDGLKWHPNHERANA